jgi:hypothetical protein
MPRAMRGDYFHIKTRESLGGGMPDSPEGLIRVCEAAHREGRDFPTVWNTILRRHRLVIGLPTHRICDGQAQITVKLATGQHVISTTSGYCLG